MLQSELENSMNLNLQYNKPRAVIFDFDGTLIGDKGMTQDFTRNADALNEKFNGDKTIDVSEGLSRKSTLGIRKSVEKIFRYFSDQTPKDGAIELLQYLKQQNIPVFVASVGNQDIIRDVVKQNFGNLIDQDKIYGAGVGIPVKPDPRTYTHILRERNVSIEHPEQIMVVGDNIKKDLKPAIDLGMKAIFFNDRNEENSQQKDKGISEVTSMRQLLDSLVTKPQKPISYKNIVVSEETELLRNRMGTHKEYGTFTANNQETTSQLGKLGI